MARKSIYYGKRATVDQMTEARALCGKDPVLIAKLENLLNRQPNDRIMLKFIDYLSDPNRHEGRFAVEVNIRRSRRRAPNTTENNHERQDMKKLTLLTLMALGLWQVAGAVDLAGATGIQPGLIPPLTVFHLVAISEVRANNIGAVPASFWVEDLTVGRTKATKCEVTLPVRLDVATERIFIDQARPAELSCPLWKHPVKVKGNLTEEIEPGPAHAMNGLAAHDLRGEQDQAQPLFTATLPRKTEASFITMEDVTVPDARGIVH